jgi:hypothetical protein
MKARTSGPYLPRNRLLMLPPKNAHLSKREGRIGWGSPNASIFQWPTEWRDIIELWTNRMYYLPNVPFSVQASSYSTLVWVALSVSTCWTISLLSEQLRTSAFGFSDLPHRNITQLKVGWCQSPITMVCLPVEANVPGPQSSSNEEFDYDKAGVDASCK